MWKMFTLNTYKWVNGLLCLVSDYNARKHRTIGMRPIDVTPTIVIKLLGTVYSAIKIAGPAKFKAGDSIIKVQHTNPIIYLLEDYRGEFVAGTFYEHELHRATHPDVYLMEKVLRRKGDKVYVKWLKFDESHNSWIHKNNVI
ncbi:uncharacterized protein LOC105422902 [Pogonomyrmex barbatus]|uniref:Uncharacterized protein LOC105422902 n=1 Tax=Pogonomyrmex barbatus TaxID=144034 RepID=A0A6I9WGB1_9HYME|nr:uncharacterized protein LOC105422902 [Pogonomyrmex barbatus]